jgi:multiple sugar transport system permease protein
VTIALLLPTSRRATIVVVTALALPLTLSGVATGLQWRLLLHGDFGAALFVMRVFGAFRGESLLGDPSRAFAALIVADVWQWTPFVCLVAFVTRVGLPNELLMAAWLDGAGAWRATIDIVLPQLRRPLVACALFRFADSFRDLDKVTVMTGGGPGSATEVIGLYLWNMSFAHGDLGYAAALSVVLYALTLLFVVVSLRSVRAYV